MIKPTKNLPLTTTGQARNSPSGKPPILELHYLRI
jgi:hypothetical protein